MYDAAAQRSTALMQRKLARYGDTKIDKQSFVV
jgi:hypothetical protein